MRVSKLFIIAWVFSTLINASLPPTTLSGQSSATKPTTFTFKAPYSQATQISGIESLIETGDENMLVDPGMESSGVSAYTCTVGTCTKTTVSGEFSSGKQALKVALSSQAMNVSQTVNTPLGIQKQGYVRVLYRVPATMADFQICSIVNSAEQTCVPTNNLIKDDTFRSIEIPLIFNATNAGIKFKTTLSYSGNAFFDAAVVAQGLGTQNLMLDNTYSAQANISAVVSGLNKTGWIANGSIVGAIYTYAITGFTVAPNCWAVNSQQGAGSARLLNTISTATTVAVEVTNNAGATSSTTMSIGCQKSGNDYLAASSSVYSQASGNYSRRAYTPTLVGLGTGATSECYESREGEYNNIDCRITAGTSIPASEIRVPLPSGLTTTAITGALKVIGKGNTNISATTNFSGISVLMAAGLSYVTIGAENSTQTGLSSSLGNTLIGTGGVISFTARVPISGWSNSNVIVGSFAGVPAVPGYQGSVDTFSVSFGTTNLTTICSVSPCFIDQIGSAVASITRSSVGAYVLNTTKTYIKLKCMSSVSTNTTVNLLQATMSCASCSSLPFSYVQPTVAYIDSLGTLLCQGSY